MSSGRKAGFSTFSPTTWSTTMVLRSKASPTIIVVAGFEIGSALFVNRATTQTVSSVSTMTSRGRLGCCMQKRRIDTVGAASAQVRQAFSGGGAMQAVSAFFDASMS